MLGEGRGERRQEMGWGLRSGKRDLEREVSRGTVPALGQSSAAPP